MYDTQLRACAQCAPGSTWTPGADGPECALCPAGRSWVPDRCVDCPVGRAAQTPGSTECASCPPGTFAEKPQQSACEACPQGSYTAANGSTTCEQCDSASFQTQRGATQCVSCETVIPGSVSPGTGSFSASKCQCPEGSWNMRAYSSDPFGTCVACLEGLVCPGGLLESGECCNPPLQGARIHAGAPEYRGGPVPWRVWCEDSARCPGPTTTGEGAARRAAGRALGECPPRAAGLACSTCELGWVYSKRDGRCMDCASQVSAMPVIMTVIIGIVSVLAVSLYATRELAVQSQTLLTVALTFTLSLNVLQVLGAFRKLTLDWPEPMRTVFRGNHLSNTTCLTQVFFKRRE